MSGGQLRLTRAAPLSGSNAKLKGRWRTAKKSALKVKINKSQPAPQYNIRWKVWHE